MLNPDEPLVWMLQQKKRYAADQTPPCPVFGSCGGCLFQDISYEHELAIKQSFLHEMFDPILEKKDVFHKIVPSPKEYHYRSRLDLKLKKTKQQEYFMGFSPMQGRGVVPTQRCDIAMEAIANFLPNLFKEAKAKLPEKYREANLTVRTGQEGVVHWGGIGRRSLRMVEQDYFYYDYHGRRIFFALETFFQANLSILPNLFKEISSWTIWDSKPVLFDLYGGVGLFSIALYDCIDKAYLIEENQHAVKVADYNVKYNGLNNIELHSGRVENVLPELTVNLNPDEYVVMIDPPRAGLSQDARRLIKLHLKPRHLIYLSCHPVSLLRDLEELKKDGWKIIKLIPYDFFPKTKHVETLVLLTKQDR